MVVVAYWRDAEVPKVYGKLNCFISFTGYKIRKLSNTKFSAWNCHVDTMPMRRGKMCRYVVKFGMAHRGERLDYPEIFEPLGIRSLEVATRADGLNYILLTTEKGRSKENVEEVIECYNTETEKRLDLVRLYDSCEEVVLTFSRSVMYLTHQFYQFIKREKDLSLVSPDQSTFWFWNGGSLNKPNPKRKTKEDSSSELVAAGVFAASRLE
jgi:hypothetical protein